MGRDRVQLLASSGIHELPAHFIRPAHEQPANSKAVQGVEVPKISLSQPPQLLKEQLGSACKEWGFFVLTDHGISSELIQRLQDVGKDFFGLPQEEKEKYANDPSSGSMEGYGTKMTKNLDQKVEWIDYFFHLTAPASRVNHDLWPRNPPAYREVTEEYSREIMRVVDKLLEVLSADLGLEGTALKASFGGDRIELEMKINFYPPCPQPDLALGVEPHTDMSVLTLLVQNQVPGLELWKDGGWVSVDHTQDALFVHVGDQLEVGYHTTSSPLHPFFTHNKISSWVLTNGNYKSILHRSLVSKDKLRLSWAVFAAPPGDCVIGPLPQLVDEKNPARFTTKTYKEFQYRKFNKLPQDKTT